ncbi:hypothetical protein AA21952_2124 [Acetobacter oeni LMG 21952]|nr:hypothetical protein AA21952_2124 [Acetobacter oeni LMG 21952]
MASVSDDFLRFISKIRQQNIGSPEITDLSRGQMEPDRASLAIAHSVQL